MILKKDMLTKSLKKGRTVAVATLQELSQAGGLSPPVYTYEARGSTKRPSHFFKVRFRVPKFLLDLNGNGNGNGNDEFIISTTTVSGAGRCTSKQYAKSLAALEVIHRLETDLDLPRNSLPKQLKTFLQQSKEKQKELEAISPHDAIPDCSWKAVPWDPSMSAALPASREGRISFLSHTNGCPKAMLMAKAMTLACQDALPDIVFHGNQTDEGVAQVFANLRTHTDNWIADANGSLGEVSFGINHAKAVQLALQSIYVKTMMSTSSHVLREFIKESHRLKKRKIAHRKRYQGHPRHESKFPKTKVTFQDLVDGVPYYTKNLALKNKNTQLLLDTLVEREQQQQSTSSEIMEESSPDSVSSSSFGMAKLLVKWPQHQFDAMNKLVQKIQQQREKKSEIYSPSSSAATIHNDITKNNNYNHHRPITHSPDYHQDRLQERLKVFRYHQQQTPLPIDELETKIPYQADVTILCGGTGSGKTTRYPLMVSLFSDNISSPPALASQLVADQEDGNDTPLNNNNMMRMIVAQPRRLACQAAAKRVAFEQGYSHDQWGQQPPPPPTTTSSDGHTNNKKKNRNNCPIGYSIRFESRPSNPSEDRTIDFQTIGVVLATAANDPLLSHVTHLVIDEVHERNADMDLLLSLAKTIQRQRKNHPTLPPLKIILMSATLDSAHWENYFKLDDDTIEVAKISVPDATRFPIDIVHYGDRNFPPIKVGKRRSLSDNELWKATAQLAASIIAQGKIQQGDGSSILCFLPGMEEIRTVQQMIRKALNKSNKTNFINPEILILHSSVSSSQQSKVFKPGPKCILSTNIAETSVTIPDVKYIIDPGRERQSCMLDDTSNQTLSENATVVGSQLVTVDIAKSAAKQRAGRAGRVAPGTCYRLYTKEFHDKHLPDFTKPEMLRMDLAQLVLHSISLCNPLTGDPLGLISGAPDPPPDFKLQQAVASLVEQGLVTFDDKGSLDDDRELGVDPIAEEDGLVFNEKALDGLEGLESDNAERLDDEEEGSNSKLDNRNSRISHPQLTHLGKAVSNIPASTRIGRMLILGLALGAVEPALTVASLLSVPKVFQTSNNGRNKNYEDPRWSSALGETCSDIIEQVKRYNQYGTADSQEKNRFPGGKEFAQVSRVRRQLEAFLKDLIQTGNRDQDLWLRDWNTNGDRVGAQAALICAASQHVAHLVDGLGAFATRDCAGTARIHPSSINFSHDKRCHWYVYNELRKTNSPFLHVTTAASPLELALFSNGGSRSKLDEDIDVLRDVLNWTHLADQWVPVHVASKKQRNAFVSLKNILNHDMLNEVPREAACFKENKDYKSLVALVLAALEQQRREL